MRLTERLSLVSATLLTLHCFLISSDVALARVVTDSAGRQVTVPDTVTRVFAAGPPASVLLNVLAPETMIGWIRSPRPAEKPFLAASVRDLPELGRLTGRGDTLNLEVLVGAKPDLIIDFGSLNDTYRSLADRVQSQTGIPYLLLDGRLEQTVAVLRQLGAVLGVEARAERLAAVATAMFAEADRVAAAVPEARRPRVYLARGPEGLETGTRGSINSEIIDRVGAVNVAEGLRQRGNIASVSPEQIIAWAPDAVVTLDAGFQAGVRDKPAWAPVPAVAAGKVYLSPSLPFGIIDSPPSLNRLIGIEWLVHIFYPDHATGDFRAKLGDFYDLFYGVRPSDAQLDELLRGSRGLK